MTNHHPSIPEGLTLELSPASAWESDDRRRVLLVAVNVPGYYSLPVRLLSLRAMSDAAIREQYDVRYIECETVPHTNGRTTPSLDEMAAFITSVAPKVVGFSMNIWNRDACRQLAEKIKSKHPDCCILVGGQETTNSVIDYLATTPAFDYLIDGEGERPFIEFLEALDPISNRIPVPEQVSGLHYRLANSTGFSGRANVLANLDDNPSIILADLAPGRDKNRLGILLESSRGCPFHCSFCFEGAKREKLRTASVARLSQEIDHMVARGTRYFHVMDPILCNSNLDHLADLAVQFKRIRQQHGYLSISVETYADQITEEIAGHLKEFTIFDIGLQSINPETLQAIHRRFDKQKFIAGLQRLNKTGNQTNIYLILGLPYETATTFLEGVRFALSCRPTQIFINELLLLNGTELRQRAVEYGYDFDPKPPYTVFANHWLSIDQANLLKTFAKDIEHRYNLSNMNFATRTPWRPTENRDDFQYDRMLLKSSCSQACPGCIWAADPPNRVNVPEPDFNQAKNANVELTCGDDIPIATIVHTAAQCKLAGALRIKLCAPPALFNQPQAIEQLRQAGVYLFKTFLPGDGSFGPEEYEDMLQGFQKIRHHQVLIADRKLSLHTEICMTGQHQSLDEQLQTAAKLGADYANLVSIAEIKGNNGPEGKKSDSYCHRWAEMVSTAYRHRFAVKLPETAAKALFSASEDIQGIMTSLDQVGMIYKNDMPPCWASSAKAG